MSTPCADDTHPALLLSDLLAAGQLMGTEIAVSEGVEWEISPTHARVGLGWFTERGLTEEESLAQTLLELWQRVRAPQQDPLRDARLTALAALRPEWVPLLGAVGNVLAAAELRTMLPQLRLPLAASVQRITARARHARAATHGSEFTAIPLHLQWAEWVWLTGSGSAPSADFDPRVIAAQDELDRVRPNALHLVSAPGTGWTAAQRVDRTLALVLRPYEMLLAADREAVGLTQPGTALLPADAEAVPGSDLGVGSAEASAASESDMSASEAGGDRGRPNADETDAARAGTSGEQAEGADLFAAEQAGWVEQFLDSPLGGARALTSTPHQVDDVAHHDATAEPGTSIAGVGGQNPGSVGAQSYQLRLSELGGEIADMRGVWDRVISERNTDRLALSRRASRAGEELARDRLPGVIAEVRAGVSQPAAYLTRTRRQRHHHAAGGFDYVLLVDRSSSMQGQHARAAADAALVMLEALAGVQRDISHRRAGDGAEPDLDVRTALVVYDETPLVLKPLTHGLSDEVRLRMYQEISAPRGSTRDAAALRAVAAVFGVGAGTGARLGAGHTTRRRLLFVLSDGGSNDLGAAAAVLAELRAAGVETHGIGIGSDAVVERYAPRSRRVDRPQDLAPAVRALLRDGLA